jgi:hypothetical protein
LDGDGQRVEFAFHNRQQRIHGLSSEHGRTPTTLSENRLNLRVRLPVIKSLAWRNPCNKRIRALSLRTVFALHLCALPPPQCPHHPFPAPACPAGSSSWAR